MAYKDSLLSSLIPIRYEDPINSITDLEQSGLPLIMGKGDGIHQYLSRDSRPMMRRIFNRRILWEMEMGKTGIPKWAFEM